jgi:CheY-like chemotaxis protein
VWTRLQGIPVPKILVADDNANIQKMVVLAFEERGIQVVTVGNGEAAVRRIPDLNPDLVLADIFMPVRNGYEVCEFVKKDERFAHVPVILLVGAFDPLDEKEARRVGADGVLKKPFVPPDPLVAMVMSALEKNPKVVAEMAKAKEAKEVLPEPVAQMEIPSRAEPKPLPDFPEPTPEEAAMVYGFGKGVRALDDEQPEAAAGPKPPVAETEEDDEAEFDGASTSSDWRRNAMDFEIPADVANKPAFSSEEDLDPATFPSEKDYPPRHVRAPIAIEEADPVVQNATPEVAREAAREVAPEVASAKPAAAAIESSTATTLSAPSAASDSAPSWKLQAEREFRDTPIVEAESLPEHSSSPAAAHWMDALSPDHALHTGGGWMSSVSPKIEEKSEEKTAEKEPAVAPPAASSNSQPRESSPSGAIEAREPIREEARDKGQDVVRDDSPAHANIEASDDFELRDEVVEHAAAASRDNLAVHGASIARDEAVTPETAETRSDAPDEVHAAVARPESEALFPVSHAVHDEPVPSPAEAPSAMETQAAESWFAPTPSVFDSDPVAAPVPVVSSERDHELELDSDDAGASVALRDPGLDESPAVHVTPEPLLVDEDESHGPSEYGLKKQDLEPLHSFFAPASGDPVVEEPVEAKSSEREEMSVPSYEPPSHDSDERIPTGPPPSREALADIPFLTPPADFHRGTPESTVTSPETVDEVVRKVLERLEPQIHDLLSQGVLKPLVENLLQSELAKKGK